MNFCTPWCLVDSEWPPAESGRQMESLKGCLKRLSRGCHVIHIPRLLCRSCREFSSHVLSPLTCISQLFLAFHVDFKVCWCTARSRVYARIRRLVGRKPDPGSVARLVDRYNFCVCLGFSSVQRRTNCCQLECAILGITCGRR